MKASQIIKIALESHYVLSMFTEGVKHDQSEYMCSAVEYAINAAGHATGSTEFYELRSLAQSTFMKTIESEDTICLTVYLKLTNRRYAYYVRDFGHSSKACFNARVKWWLDLIATLESKGQ